MHFLQFLKHIDSNTYCISRHIAVSKTILYFRVFSSIMNEGDNKRKIKKSTKQKKCMIPTQNLEQKIEQGIKSNKELNMQFVVEEQSQNAEDYPTQGIIEVDDHFNQMMGYIQCQNLCFTGTQYSSANKNLLQAYEITKDIKKYFAERYFLFSRFDEGILLDRQSWYSVVPEPISMYLCHRLYQSGVSVLLEPFCGVGGLTVHCSGYFKKYFVNDLDENKIKMMKNNLAVYGKGVNQVKVFNKDFFDLKPFHTKCDAVIACPPWGGIDISRYAYDDLDEIMSPRLSDILNHCKKFSNNIVVQLPKNTNISNLMKVINMCHLSPLVKIEKIYINQRLSQLFVFIGEQQFTRINPEVYNVILTNLFRERCQVTTAINFSLALRDLQIRLNHNSDYNCLHELYLRKNTDKRYRY